MKQFRAEPREGDWGLKIKVFNLHSLSFGEETIDLGCVEQLYDKGQTAAIGTILELLITAVQTPNSSPRTLAELLQAVDREIDAQARKLFCMQLFVSCRHRANKPSAFHKPFKPFLQSSAIARTGT